MVNSVSCRCHLASDDPCQPEEETRKNLDATPRPLSTKLLSDSIRDDTILYSSSFVASALGLALRACALMVILMVLSLFFRLGRVCSMGHATTLPSAGSTA